MVRHLTATDLAAVVVLLVAGCAGKPLQGDRKVASVEGDMLDRQIERQASRLNEVIRTGAYRMLEPQTKAVVVNDLKMANDLMVRPNVPGPVPVPPHPVPVSPPPSIPVPYPVPYPVPFPPGHDGHHQVFEIVADGLFQDVPFHLEAERRASLYNQCQDFIRMNPAINRIDSLRVSFNGRAYIFERNVSSYWTGDQAICSILDNEATPEAVMPPREGRQIVVEGYVEQERLSFQGNSFDAIYNQCVEMFKSPASKVDDMEISVNGARRETFKNVSSWWVGPQQICDTLTGQVPRY